MWKNIHVELEFLRLEFHRFIFSFFFYVFFFLAFYFFLLLLRSSTLQIWRLDRLIAHLAVNHPIGAPRFFVLRSSSSDPFFLCSLSLFFIILFFLFFFKSILQVPKSSLRDSVLLFRTRVYKTWDLFGIIFPTHQLGIESLTLKF